MIAEHTRLCLLGGFQLLLTGRPVRLPVQAQRVLVLLAVRGVEQSRSTLAGTLWDDVPERRAQANLRNAVWRIRLISDAVLTCTRSSVALSGHVALDLDEAQGHARSLLAADAGEFGRPVGQGCRDGRARGPTDALDALDRDLLPAWDEDWLVIERERQRQLRMHALEALSASLCQAGRYAEAITAALAAVRAEPLRESAQRALITAHLGEGNICEAVRQLAGYRELLADELGIAPSAQLRDLVGVARRYSS